MFVLAVCIAVLTHTSFYDVPTFFGRDVSRFRDFANLWYGDSKKLASDASVSNTSEALGRNRLV